MHSRDVSVLFMQCYSWLAYPHEYLSIYNLGPEIVANGSPGREGAGTMFHGLDSRIRARLRHLGDASILCAVMLTPDYCQEFP
jgi:hypothetical protein